MNKLSIILSVLVLTGCLPEKSPDGRPIKDGVTCKPTKMYIYEAQPVGWRRVYVCDDPEMT